MPHIRKRSSSSPYSSTHKDISPSRRSALDLLHKAMMFYIKAVSCNRVGTTMLQSSLEQQQTKKGLRKRVGSKWVG